MRKVLLLSDHAGDKEAVRKACEACGLILEPAGLDIADAGPMLAIFFDSGTHGRLVEFPKALKIGILDQASGNMDLFSETFDDALWFLRPLDRTRIEHCLRYLLTQLSHGDHLHVSLDVESCLATISNRQVELSELESRVLLAFAQSGPHAITTFEGMEKTEGLVQSIAAIRTLFSEAGYDDAITTVPRVGYRLRSDIRITC